VAVIVAAIRLDKTGLGGLKVSAAAEPTAPSGGAAAAPAADAAGQKSGMQKAQEMAGVVAKAVTPVVKSAAALTNKAGVAAVKATKAGVNKAMIKIQDKDFREQVDLTLKCLFRQEKANRKKECDSVGAAKSRLYESDPPRLDKRDLPLFFKETKKHKPELQLDTLVRVLQGHFFDEDLSETYKLPAVISSIISEDNRFDETGGIITESKFGLNRQDEKAEALPDISMGEAKTLREKGTALLKSAAHAGVAKGGKVMANVVSDYHNFRPMNKAVVRRGDEKEALAAGAEKQAEHAVQAVPDAKIEEEKQDVEKELAVAKARIIELGKENARMQYECGMEKQDAKKCATEKQDAKAQAEREAKKGATEKRVAREQADWYLMLAKATMSEGERKTTETAENVNKVLVQCLTMPCTQSDWYLMLAKATMSEGERKMTEAAENVNKVLVQCLTIPCGDGSMENTAEAITESFRYEKSGWKKTYVNAGLMTPLVEMVSEDFDSSYQLRLGALLIGQLADTWCSFQDKMKKEGPEPDEFTTTMFTRLSVIEMKETISSGQKQAREAIQNLCRCTNFSEYKWCSNDAPWRLRLVPASNDK